MSKCREAFRGIYQSIPPGDVYLIWKAAWNARGKVDAEICLNWQSSDRYLIDYEMGCYDARKDCVVAIEQEQCE